MATTDDRVRALRLKLDTARSVLGDALDGVRRGLALLDEIRGELEEQSLAGLKAKLDSIREQAAVETAPEAQVGAPPAVVRAHFYPGVAAAEKGEALFTSDCAHGCGAWMGGSRSGAPGGVDPFGECPNAPVAPSLVAHVEPFKLSAPEPAPVKRERPERPIPADWVPNSRTRIRLASLGIDVGPNSRTLVAYRTAMAGKTKKTWGDKDFEAWARSEQPQAAGATAC